MGGDRAPVGPTGLWERFAPGPGPEGPAEILVEVRDAAGEPVADAEVYLAPPDVVETRGVVSFGDLRGLGRTGADGTRRADLLPEGRAAVVANLAGLLNRERGLAAVSAAPVTLRGGAPARAEVRLPFTLASLGRVEVTVADGDGRPLGGARVTIGFQGATTGPDGTASLRHVPAGGQDVSADRTGYEVASVRVDVSPGGKVTAALVLTLHEAGALRLSCRVTGPDGEPVPAARVYVNALARSGRVTLRLAETDAQGRIDLSDLPDRLAHEAFWLFAMAKGFRPADLDLPSLPASEVVLRLPSRVASLRLTLVDASTGALLRRCRLEARSEGDGRPVASFSSYARDGVFTTDLPPGRYLVTIEAPEHAATEETWDVPASGGDFPRTVRLLATGATGAEVALTIAVTDAAAGTPVSACRVTLSDPTSGVARASVSQSRADGRFPLPIPAGDWRLRVEADGYAAHEAGIRVPAATTAEIPVALRR